MIGVMSNGRRGYPPHLLHQSGDGCQTFAGDAEIDGRHLRSRNFASQAKWPGFPILAHLRPTIRAPFFLLPISTPPHPTPPKKSSNMILLIFYIYYLSRVWRVHGKIISLELACFQSVWSWEMSEKPSANVYSSPVHLFVPPENPHPMFLEKQRCGSKHIETGLVKILSTSMACHLVTKKTPEF